MPSLSSLVCLFAGASLLALVTQMAIPPVTWVAVTLLLHASRSMPVGPGAVSVWLVVFVAMTWGYRCMMPVPGAAYFATVAAMTTTIVLPFVIDRVSAGRLAGAGSTLVFPAAFVAAEFLRSRFAPAATWGSIAYTQFGCLPLMQVAAFVGIWGITFVIT